MTTKKEEFIQAWFDAGELTHPEKYKVPHNLPAFLAKLKAHKLTRLFREAVAEAEEEDPEAEAVAGFGALFPTED